jgi:hypothetical protein
VKTKFSGNYMKAVVILDMIGEWSIHTSRIVSDDITTWINSNFVGGIELIIETDKGYKKKHRLDRSNPPTTPPILYLTSQLFSIQKTKHCLVHATRHTVLRSSSHHSISRVGIFINYDEYLIRVRYKRWRTQIACPRSRQYSDAVTSTTCWLNYRFNNLMAGCGCKDETFLVTCE